MESRGLGLHSMRSDDANANAWLAEYQKELSLPLFRPLLVRKGIGPATDKVA
jgi:hypothetical protein